MEAITEAMGTTHMGDTAAVIGTGVTTMATTTLEAITRTIRHSSADFQSPSQFRSPVSEWAANLPGSPGFQSLARVGAASSLTLFS
jgi:hypothetical protein